MGRRRDRISRGNKWGGTGRGGTRGGEIGLVERRGAGRRGGKRKAEEE